MRSRGRRHHREPGAKKPLKTHEGERSGARSGTNETGGPPTPLRLLIVDDERIVRRLAARILGHRGYEVIETACGEAAVEAVGADERPLALAVVDYQMQGMNGVETIRALRRLRPGMTAIIATGHTEPIAGADDPGAVTHILHKPYTATELERAVQRALSATSESERPRTTPSP